MCNLHANIATAEAMRRLFQVSDENDRLGNAPARPAIFPKGEAPELPQWSRKTTKRGSIEDVLGFLRPISSAKMRIIKHGIDERADSGAGL